ncbi:MAG: cadherin repeat domain-containing protein [Fibrobacter sp.]|nr:cadherin repeat domain-containing protein [Fibrobacter sp.]
MRERRENLRFLSLLVLGLALQAFAAPSWPMYFSNVTMTDSATMQETWNTLTKYKVFGEDFIRFEGQKVFIRDTVGWFGTAKGDFETKNPWHVVGGPIVIGGNIRFTSGDGSDSLLKGPIRVLGSVTMENHGNPDAFDGDACVQNKVNDYFLTELRSGKAYVGNYSGTKVVENYGDCPSSVPEVDGNLEAPRLVDGEFSRHTIHPALNINGSVETIDVPPRSLSDEKDSVYDYYIESISLENGGTLVIRMPKSGRLTRIFLQNGFTKINSHSSIRILYMDSDKASDYNTTTGKWKNGVDPIIWKDEKGNIKDPNGYIGGSDYKGNLLFYSNGNISIDAMNPNDVVHGTLISSGTIWIKQHMTYAGQILAKKIVIDSEFDGEFIYMPFDPPAIDIYGKITDLEFEENDSLVEVPVTLDKVPETDVSITYCFKSAEKVFSNWADGKDLNLNDVDAAWKKMPLCEDTEWCIEYDESHSCTKSVTIPKSVRTVTIPRKNTSAQSDDQKVWINVYKDGITEGKEKIILQVTNIVGAVIQNNQTSGGIALTLKDYRNRVPSFLDEGADFEVYENKLGDTAGVVKAIDEDGDALNFGIVGGSDKDYFELQKIDNASTRLVLKADSAVDFEALAKKNFKLEVVIAVTDGKIETPVTKTFYVNVLDVNEKPIINDAVINSTSPLKENAKNGTLVGRISLTDTDSTMNGGSLLHPELSIYNVAIAIDGDTAALQIDSVHHVKTGKNYALVYVKNSDLIDYELDSILTLKILVRDTSVYTVDEATNVKTYPLEDSAMITIKVKDEDDIPVIDTTTTDTTTIDSIHIPNISKLDLDKKKQGSVPENNALYEIAGKIFATCSDSTKPLYYEITKDTSSLFAMDPKTGVVTVGMANALNYELVNEYAISVKVSDGEPDANGRDKTRGYKVQSVTRDVVIRVIDLNENPIISEGQTFYFGELLPANSFVDSVKASDIDTSYKFTQHKFVLIGGDTTMFKIDLNSGAVYTLTEFDFDSRVTSGDTTFTIDVRVIDKEPAPDGVSELSDTATVTIILRDANEQPKIVSDTIYVVENTPGGTIVDTIKALDPDGDNDKLTFTMVGESQYFNLTSEGVVIVKDGANIDYEHQVEPSFSVRVTDMVDGVHTKSVVVYIIDVNEPPVLDDQEFVVEENKEIGFEVGKVVARDPDTDPKYNQLTYTLLTKTDKFEILTDGTIKVIGDLDYEDVKKYVFDVEVSDGEFQDTGKVTIRIKNIIEQSFVDIVEGDNSEKTWDHPDTIYTNIDTLNIVWTQCVKTMDRCDTLSGTDSLTEGKNIIIKRFKDPTTDIAGADTVVVYYSTSAPIVTVSKDEDPAFKTNIYTVVENTGADSSTFFVNYKKNDVYVHVSDAASNKDTSFNVSLMLDTISIPSLEYKIMADIVESTLPLNVNAPNAVRTPMNNDLLAFSYTDTFEGHEVKVTYYTDKMGNVVKGESGSEEMTISYVEVIGKDTVTFSFQADAVTGHLIKTENNGSFKVSYEYEDANHNRVTVGYNVNENGKLAKNSGGDVGYEVSYTYVNAYGNSAKKSLKIVYDTKPPLVWIKSPVDDQVLSSNMAEVEWYVSATGDSADFVLQDTLAIQGLEKGANTIVRFFVDKAGNRASDTVYVIMKDAKDVDIQVEQPVTIVTAKKVEEYYSENKPKKGQTFAVSIKNPRTEVEKETVIGGLFKTREGSGAEPYPGKKGHLGPTVGIEVKLPVYNSVGGLATLDDLIGKDGLVSLDGIDAANSEKKTVEEYVKQYCTAEFASSYGTDFSKANLYNTTMKVTIWIFTSLGSFVDKYSFTQEMNDADFVDDAGMLQMYFEQKPDKNGYVHTQNGRLYSTGAYIYKTEVEMKSSLKCTLPPVNDEANTQKMGALRKTTEEMRKAFGYKRPDSGKKKK